MLTSTFQKEGLTTIRLTYHEREDSPNCNERIYVYFVENMRKLTQKEKVLQARNVEFSYTIAISALPVGKTFSFVFEFRKLALAQLHLE